MQSSYEHTPRQFDDHATEDVSDFESEARKKIFDAIEMMERAESLWEEKEAVRLFLDAIESDNEFDLKDVNEIYKEINPNKYLLRLEDIARVLHTLKDRQPLHVDGGDSKYANAVVPDNEGIKIAFSEGEAIGPVRTLVSFDFKSAIGFEKKNLIVEDIDSNNIDPRNMHLRAAVCRHIAGDIAPDSIKYLILRIPRHLFPESMLSDIEAETETPYIFRGAKINLYMEDE